MGKTLNLLIFFCFVLLITSFFKRNALPEKIEPNDFLLGEPKQQAIQKAPFSVRYEDVAYTVEPQYEYDLYGLVVSYRHHDGDSMLHKLWNDHLNMADVCVVWGQTAMSAYLNQIKFWNGQFTCNFQTSSQVAWNSFSPYQISNNHLISEDDFIRKKITKMNIGDQIRVKGFLSAYSPEGGGKRGTSTVRTDTGNGACETIYVNDFSIVKAGSNPWRTTMNISFFALIILLVLYFLTPHRVK